MQVIGRCVQQCSKEQCTLWGLWNRRNKWVWDRINVSVFGVKPGALNLLSDWKRAQEHKRGNTARHTGKKWEKPPEEWMKVNVDAAIFEDITCIGLGMLVRDALGKVVMARSRRREGLVTPREAEAICLKEALSWLKDKGFKKCVFETDSQILTNACKGTFGNSFFDTIVRDCIDANGAAHVLARVARSLSDVQEWHENVPPVIDHVITSEAL